MLYQAVGQHVAFGMQSAFPECKDTFFPPMGELPHRFFLSERKLTRGRLRYGRSMVWGCPSSTSVMTSGSEGWEEEAV